MLHGDAGASSSWNVRAEAETIKDSFKIKYVRVLADLSTSRIHPPSFMFIQVW